MNRAMYEIGSEFSINPEILEKPISNISFDSLGFSGDIQIVLSGRTALDRICQDIQTTRKCKTIYLPAYCCDTMIYPFTNRELDVVFYDLKTENGILQYIPNEEIHFDVLYISNYFGYGIGIPIKKIKEAKAKGVIIVYDRTHSLFNAYDPLNELADYMICSLRKWMEIPAGAIVTKRNGKFCINDLKECFYPDTKFTGMVVKHEYINGNADVSKESFFKLFNEFAYQLEKDYVDYAIDEKSETILERLDIQDVAERRRKNAKVLYHELSDVNEISFMWAEARDVSPLFVPILINDGTRNDLRRFLINNNVFLPIHWPQPKATMGRRYADDIYDRELSLVCDQRYAENDMRHITRLIRKFYNK